MSRMDEYLMAIITGENEDLPEPRSSTEREFYEAAKRGLGGGELPFGETTVTKEAITWDGNTEGLDSVMGMLYHVSNAVPTLGDMQNGGTIKCVTPDGEMTVDFTGEHVMDAETAGMGNGIIILNGGNIPMLIATQDGATMTEGETTITFEKAGIYLPSADGAYISYFAINNYQFEDVEITPIDPKYLPKTKTRTIFYIDRNGDDTNLYLDKGYSITATPQDVNDAPRCRGQP